MKDECAQVPVCRHAIRDAADCVPRACPHGTTCDFELRTKFHHLALMTSLHFTHEQQVANAVAIANSLDSHWHTHDQLNAEIGRAIADYQLHGNCFNAIRALGSFANHLVIHTATADASLLCQVEGLPGRQTG